MKEWKKPEVWELAAEYTKGALVGDGEDHIRVSSCGHKLWGDAS